MRHAVAVAALAALAALVTPLPRGARASEPALAREASVGAVGISALRSARRPIDIEDATLSAALRTLSEAYGVPCAAAPALLARQAVVRLSGTFSLDQALDFLLAQASACGWWEDGRIFLVPCEAPRMAWTAAPRNAAPVGPSPAVGVVSQPIRLDGRAMTVGEIARLVSESGAVPVACPAEWREAPLGSIWADATPADLWTAVTLWARQTASEGRSGGPDEGPDNRLDEGHSGRFDSGGIEGPFVLDAMRATHTLVPF